MDNFLSTHRRHDCEFLREGWDDYCSGIEGRINAAIAYLKNCGEDDAKIGGKLKELGFRYVVCDGMTRKEYLEFFEANLNQLELSDFSGNERTMLTSPSSNLPN